MRKKDCREIWNLCAATDQNDCKYLELNKQGYCKYCEEAYYDCSYARCKRKDLTS